MHKAVRFLKIETTPEPAPWDFWQKWRGKRAEARSLTSFPRHLAWRHLVSLQEKEPTPKKTPIGFQAEHRGSRGWPTENRGKPGPLSKNGKTRQFQRKAEFESGNGKIRVIPGMQSSHSITGRVFPWYG